MSGREIRTEALNVKHELYSRVYSGEAAVGAEYAVRFTLTFVLALSQIYGECAPFAAAMVGSCVSTGACIASLVAACAGYFLSGESLVEAVMYSAASVMAASAVLTFRRTSLSQKEHFMPIVVAIIFLVVDFAGIINSRFTLEAFTRLSANALLSGSCTLFFRTALSPWSGKLSFDMSSELRHTISVVVLFASLLMAFSHLEILHCIAPARIIAILTVMIASFKGGPGAGCCFGVALGIAMDASFGAETFFCMVYGVLGLIAGAFSKNGRLPFTLSAALTITVTAVIGAERQGAASVLYEAFFASLIFILMPESFVSRAGAILPGGDIGLGEKKARENTKKRVDMTSLAFRDLYETVKSSVSSDTNDSDAAAVFDRAAETVCRGCESMNRCWSENYTDTQDIFNGLTKKMMERGSVSENDFPQRFLRACPNIIRLKNAINAEVRSLMYRRQLKSRVNGQRSVAYNQYSDISSILSDIALELDASGTDRQETESRLNRYITSLGYKADAAAYSDRHGRLRIEISGGDTAFLMKDGECMRKLSEIAGTHLCTKPSQNTSDHVILTEAEPFAATVGVSSVSRDGDMPSGDRGAYFKTDDGILHVLLSDGMGTGSEAAGMSSDAVRVLERFLRSGVNPETSVRMLNDLMLLKNEEDTVCATIDLVSVNLFSGEANMFKYGAAASYLAEGKKVRRVRGESLAAGLGVPPNDAPDHIRMKLTGGAFAVMVSDGVTNGLDDDWLVEMLTESGDVSPRELSRRIIEEASERFGGEDDMTAFVIKVEKRVFK